MQCYRGWYVETSYTNTIFGKLSNLKSAILTRHTPTLGTQDLPGGFKEEKACLVEIKQTARPLETNAHANFPIAENAAYQCMENGGGETCPH